MSAKVETFKVYCDARGEWRWRLVARNGRTIADSGEGYSSLSGVKRAIRTVKRASELQVIEVEQ